MVDSVWMTNVSTDSVLDMHRNIARSPIGTDPTIEGH